MHIYFTVRFNRTLFTVGNKPTFFCLRRVDQLPLSIRVLLEAAIRNCDGFYTKEEDIQNILDWQQQQNKAEVPFSPARVLLQDFTWVSHGRHDPPRVCVVDLMSSRSVFMFLLDTWGYDFKGRKVMFPSPVSFDSGIPAMVDLAAMRDAVAKHGMDPGLVNPKCPTDLIVDHSLQIDYSKWCVCFYIFHLYIDNKLKWVKTDTYLTSSHWIFLYFHKKSHQKLLVFLWLLLTLIMLLFLLIFCDTTFIFVSTVPYRMLQTQVEVTAQTRARVHPDPHPPGLCPEEAHIVEASGALVVKPPAVTLQPPQVNLQRLSSRSRIHLSSALSTWSLYLSEFFIHGCSSPLFYNIQHCWYHKILMK